MLIYPSNRICQTNLRRSLLLQYLLHSLMIKKLWTCHYHLFFIMSNGLLLWLLWELSYPYIYVIQIRESHFPSYVTFCFSLSFIPGFASCYMIQWTHWSRFLDVDLDIFWHQALKQYLFHRYIDLVVDIDLYIFFSVECIYSIFEISIRFRSISRI